MKPFQAREDFKKPELQQISLADSSYMSVSDRSHNPQENMAQLLSSMEKKHLRLQKQMILVEQENSVYREKQQTLAAEVERLMTLNENLKDKEKYVEEAEK